MILIVLESVAARWTGLNGGPYDTTPTLKAEVGARRSCSTTSTRTSAAARTRSVAILLSTYPKLDFRDLTEEYPQLPGTSLASLFRDRGYRTAFVTPSDLSWAGWGPFLDGAASTSVRDYHQLRVRDR